MEHFKVKGMPRLRLITCKITSLFFSSKRSPAEPPVTTSGAAAGTKLKGLLCTDRHKDGSGLLIKPFQREGSHYMNSVETTRCKLCMGPSQIWDFSQLFNECHEIFSCHFCPIALKPEIYFSPCFKMMISLSLRVCFATKLSGKDIGKQKLEAALGITLETHNPSR